MRLVQPLFGRDWVVGMDTKENVRSACKAVLEKAGIPDVDAVMEGLSEGLEELPLLAYTEELSGRADMFLEELIKLLDQETTVPAPTVHSLLEQLYPRAPA